MVRQWWKPRIWTKQTIPVTNVADARSILICIPSGLCTGCLGRRWYESEITDIEYSLPVKLYVPGIRRTQQPLGQLAVQPFHGKLAAMPTSRAGGMYMPNIIEQVMLEFIVHRCYPWKPNKSG